VWRSGKPASGGADKGKQTGPAFIQPQLATLQREAPGGPDWLHEVKFDGYRMQAVIAGVSVRLLTRSGLDWTERFGTRVVSALAGLKCKDAAIDGEIVVLGGDGVSSFSLLQADLSDGRTERFIYFAFDLMQLDGVDLRSEPFVERKEALRQLLSGQGDD